MSQGPGIFLCAPVCSGCGAAHAQPAHAPGLQLEQRQLQRQQERHRALHERIAPGADVLQGAPAPAALAMP